MSKKIDKKTYSLKILPHFKSINLWYLLAFVVLIWRSHTFSCSLLNMAQPKICRKIHENITKNNTISSKSRLPASAFKCTEKCWRNSTSYYNENEVQLKPSHKNLCWWRTYTLLFKKNLAQGLVLKGPYFFYLFWDDCSSKSSLIVP